MKKGICMVALGIGMSFLWACGGEQKATNETEGASTANNAEVIFQTRCAMCHDFKTDKIGPSLAGVHSRWGGDKARLKSFIKNSQEVIRGGDAYAIALYEKWHHSAMPAFNDLTEEELNQLVEYLQ